MLFVLSAASQDQFCCKANMFELKQTNIKALYLNRSSARFPSVRLGVRTLVFADLCKTVN